LQNFEKVALEKYESIEKVLTGVQERINSFEKAEKNEKNGVDKTFKNLEKVALEKYEKSERVLTEVQERINSLEKTQKNEKNGVEKNLQNFEKVVLEKFEKVEKVITKSEERIALLENAEEKIVLKKVDEVEILQCEFNLTPKLQAKFQLADNLKTALSRLSKPGYILAKQSIPKLKKSKFSFKIGKSDWIMVGITTNKYFNEDYVIYNPANFGYSHDGKFYLETLSPSNYSQYKEGDQVSFTCDLSTGLIQVDLNGKFIGSHTISKTHLESETFYPYLYTNNNSGLGATFI